MSFSKKIDLIVVKEMYYLRNEREQKKDEDFSS
jgi:hypothetical protein